MNEVEICNRFKLLSRLWRNRKLKPAQVSEWVGHLLNGDFDVFDEGDTLEVIGYDLRIFIAHPYDDKNGFIHLTEMEPKGGIRWNGTVPLSKELV